MRKLFGVWLLLAAGCAPQTAIPDITAADPPQAVPGLAMPVPPAPVLALRVGVEYLPPERLAVDLPLPDARKRLTLSDGPTDRLDPLAGPLEPTPVQVLPPEEPVPDRPSWRRRPSPESSRSAELVARIDLSRERIATVDRAPGAAPRSARCPGPCPNPVFRAAG